MVRLLYGIASVSSQDTAMDHTTTVAWTDSDPCDCITIMLLDNERFCNPILGTSPYLQADIGRLKAAL
jgi:hypothetical protein